MRTPDVEFYVPCPCNVVMDRLAAALEAEGWAIYPSFDLQTAIRPLAQCTCPHHGTERCGCQYAVWCACPPHGPAAQLIFHGRDQDTWVACAGEPNVVAQLVAAIERVVARLPRCARPPVESHS